MPLRRPARQQTALRRTTRWRKELVMAQEIHESDEDALLRAQCDLYGEEIRADYEDQEDEEDPEELDLFLDRCPECNGSDIELGYNSADDTIYTRCTQCNLRASRE